VSFLEKITKIFEVRTNNAGDPLCDACGAVTWVDEQPLIVKKRFPNSPKQGRSFIAKNWKKVMGKDSNAYICLACFEKKLGRPVTVQDLDLSNPLNRNITEVLAAKQKKDGPLY
jgi:hypothetical protein